MKDSSEYKKWKRYSVRFNGIVTSISLPIPIIALYLTLADCQIDPHELMKMTIRKILSEMSAKNNRHISEMVVFKILESLLDTRKEIKQFYRYVIKVNSHE